MGVRPPPLIGHNFQTFFYHTFFLQLNPTYMKRILHLVSVKNIIFKSSYIDILRQLWSLTTNYLAMFIVTSTTIFTYYKAQTMCKTRFNCWGMILNGFNPSLMTGILIMYTSGTVAGGSKLSILLVHMCLSCRFPPHPTMTMHCNNVIV